MLTNQADSRPFDRSVVAPLFCLSAQDSSGGKHHSVHRRRQIIAYVIYLSPAV